MATVDIDVERPISQSEATNERWIRVGPRDELTGVTVVSGGRHGIAVFPSAVSDAVYAVDNRCPHMGFPLHRGSVADGILTCHWHHARFDLESGGTFDPWADDVQTYATFIEDGIVYVDPRPRGDNRVSHAKARLWDGLEQDLNLVIVKNVLALLEASVPPATVLETGGRFGTTYRRAGWRSGLTILAAMGNVLPNLRPDDQALALYHGLVNVAADCAGQPPRFALDPLDTPDVPASRLKRWFRSFVEVRDADGAERTLLTAIASGLPAATLADMLAAAATDHVFLDGGHTLDFINKACELLDQIGWHEATTILPSLVPGLAMARRSEELTSWRHPVDLIALMEPEVVRLPELFAASGSNPNWQPTDVLIATLLGDDPGGDRGIDLGGTGRRSTGGIGRPQRQLRRRTARRTISHQQRVRRLDHGPAHLQPRQRRAPTAAEGAFTGAVARGLSRRDATLSRSLLEHAGRALAGRAPGATGRASRGG